MNARDVISLLVVYVAVYYFNARRLLAQLERIDPEYWRGLGSNGGFGMSNSLAIGKLLFDSDLPKKAYPDDFKSRLKLVRVMLLLGPVIAVALALVSSRT